MAEELYYSLALISAVLVFQAIVRYSNKRTQRLRQEAYCRTTSSSNSHNNASSPALSYTSLPELDATCAESLDGDEPPVFFELLSQTGSEMMNTVSANKVGTQNCYRSFLLTFNYLYSCHFRVTDPLKTLSANAWTVMKPKIPF